MPHPHPIAFSETRSKPLHKVLEQPMSLRSPCWWARRDSNPQALRHKILNLACLPVPPLTHQSTLQTGPYHSATPLTRHSRHERIYPEKDVLSIVIRKKSGMHGHAVDPAARLRPIHPDYAEAGFVSRFAVTADDLACPSVLPSNSSFVALANQEARNEAW